jgi:hypothetical protein
MPGVSRSVNADGALGLSALSGKGEPMASIAKRPNGQWRARYRDDAGKEHARHFPRKIDAQR